MSVFTIDKIRIAGLSVGVPAKNIDNRFNTLFDAQQAETFVDNIGIGNLRRAENKSLTDLCLPIGEALIKDLNWSKEDIKILILITQTPDYKIPPSSLILQDKLGLSTSCLAFDINLGCSGYVYGLSVIASLMKSTLCHKALLFVGDISSSCISEKDQSTAPIFSDAVSVTAIEMTDDASLQMLFNLQSDGAGYQAIIIEDGGSKHKLTEASLQYTETTKGLCKRPIDMQLNGIQVFNFALKEVAANIKELLTYAELTSDQVDYFVLHQANKLINESIRKKLKLEADKMPSSLFDYGNTSSASIPLTLAHCLRDKLNREKTKLVLAGFGVGLSWGSVVLVTHNIVCEIKELDNF